MWAYLTESLKDLKSIAMEDLLAQMKEINTNKSQVREHITQCKDLVDSKIAE